MAKIKVQYSSYCSPVEVMDSNWSLIRTEGEPSRTKATYYVKRYFEDSDFIICPPREVIEFVEDPADATEFDCAEAEKLVEKWNRRELENLSETAGDTVRENRNPEDGSTTTIELWQCSDSRHYEVVATE